MTTAVRIPLVLIVGIALAALAAVGPPRAEAGADAAAAAFEPAPGGNGAIFFEALDGIWRINADGTGRTQISTVGGNPAPSPDGQQVLYSYYADGASRIFLMNADGTGSTQVGPGFRPEWSPDGGHIVFSCRDSNDDEICTMDLDGTHRAQLTDNAVNDDSPSYSPDGLHIVFARGSSVMRIDADGSNPVVLDSQYDRIMEDPSYSPDGLHIVYAGDTEAYNQTADIFRIDADGSNRVTLAGGGTWDLHPAYSPDGQYIAFATDTSVWCGGLCYNYYRDVLVMNADGTGRTLVTAPDYSGYDFDPAWAATYQPCQGQVPTLTGTPGADVLKGSPGRDVISGYGGNDVIDGGGGADIICGGPGTDTVTYATHELDVTASPGGVAGDDGSSEDGPLGARDSIAADVERLVGGYGDDTLTGGPGADVLTGGPGDDTLSGGAGRDTLIGSSGEDALDGGDDIDVLRGLSGQDVLHGGPGNDNLDGGVDADDIDGGDGSDTATYTTRGEDLKVTIGNGAADDGSFVDGPAGYRDDVEATVERLIGGRGDDSLTGNAGNNRIDGGRGADSLWGLGGADTLVADDGFADAVLDCGAGLDPLALYDAGVDPAPVSCGER